MTKSELSRYLLRSIYNAAADLETYDHSEPEALKIALSDIGMSNSEFKELKIMAGSN